MRLATGRSAPKDDPTPELALSWPFDPAPARRESLVQELRSFQQFGQPTRILETNFADANGRTRTVPTFVNEFWTARQRQAHSIHEVSYRACFKPQLPRFFIERLTAPGETVYDPFMGRGTTAIEAALLGRVPFGCDINPLSKVMTLPRLNPPTFPEIEERLKQIDFHAAAEKPGELLVFYHPETLREICALKNYLLARQRAKALDAIDEWIRLLALNRLTGHSGGFFSAYTLPPNQAVSVKSQQKINAKRNQSPPRRDVSKLILKKSRQLLGDCDSRTRQTLRSIAARIRRENWAFDRG